MDSMVSNQSSGDDKLRIIGLTKFEHLLVLLDESSRLKQLGMNYLGHDFHPFSHLNSSYLDADSQRRDSVRVTLYFKLLYESALDGV